MFASKIMAATTLVLLKYALDFADFHPISQRGGASASATRKAA
jgi:hypothetical protein